MILITNLPDFTNAVVDFIRRGNEFLKFDIRNPTADEYRGLKSGVETWIEEVVGLLDSSFDIIPNSYSTEFKQARRQVYNVPNVGQNVKQPFQLVNELKEDINAKIRSLEYIPRILDVSDAVVRPAEVNLVDRNTYTTEQILGLILDKLYELYDNEYHSVVAILNGNGIRLRRNYEDREFGQALEQTGYVDILTQGDTFAKLTLEGRMYVEEKRRSFLENYDDIHLNHEELNRRLDEITERLNKLGLGQEIIFDELQELRDLYLKLNTKTWTQLLKGKLLDLALAKIIENDTISYLYEKLTNHPLRLP